MCVCGELVDAMSAASEEGVGWPCAGAGGLFDRMVVSVKGRARVCVAEVNRENRLRTT